MASRQPERHAVYSIAKAFPLLSRPDVDMRPLDQKYYDVGFDLRRRERMPHAVLKTLTNPEGCGDRRSATEFPTDERNSLKRIYTAEPYVATAEP